MAINLALQSEHGSTGICWGCYRLMTTRGMSNLQYSFGHLQIVVESRPAAAAVKPTALATFQFQL